jgi:hypothetical protein
VRQARRLDEGPPGVRDLNCRLRLDVVRVIGVGGGARHVLEKVELDVATLIHAVRTEVACDLRAVLVGSLVLRAVDICLEVI